MGIGVDLLPLMCHDREEVRATVNEVTSIVGHRRNVGQVVGNAYTTSTQVRL